VIADPEAAGLEAERRAVERAQAGELRALEPVLAAHAEPLFAMVLARLGNRAQAEEVVKETLVTALERIDGFRWQERSLFFWLRRIALHRLIDEARRRGRAQRLIDALVREADEAPPPGADDALIVEEDRRRQRGRIDAALAELPARYAEAIRLRLIEEQPREACAATLGVELGNFDVILFRAVRAFRKAYGER
jgi:RNA polymerase sigma-70 factor (ECF subfamily)